jgi:hypothetical protein
VGIFRALNEATAHVYVLEGLLRGATTTASGAQECLTSENRVSQRPSPLVNAPYAEVSMQQRNRLIQALGAYEAVRTANARDAPRAELDVALAEFQSMANELNAVAAIHRSGDLFVDEGAATLVALGARLRTAKDRATIDALCNQFRPTVAKLIGILRADVGRRLREASNATQSEIDLWLTYARAAASGKRAHRSAPLPSCGEPVVPGAPAINVHRPSASTLDALPKATRAKLADAQRRSHALMALHLDPFFAALLDLDAASSPAAIAAELQRLNAATLEPKRDARSLP